jgi:hypothetical protein
MSRIDIHFGALAPALSEQIGHLIEDPKTMEHLERDADAITRLVIRGLVSDREGERARDRLFKKIVKALKSGKQPTKAES